MSITDLNPLYPYLSRIKALGYTLNSKNSESYIQPADDSWILKYLDDRWVLLIHNRPQIYFSPDEVVKFLAQRRFRKTHVPLDGLSSQPI